MSLRNTVRSLAGRAKADEDTAAEEDKAAKAAEDEDENEEDAAAEGKAAEDDEEDKDGEDGEADDDEDDEGADAKASASSVKKVRADERKRIKAILGAKGAANAPELAAHYAFDTDMSSKAAIAALAHVPEGTKGSDLRERMSGKNAKLGTGAQGKDGNTADSRLVQFAQRVKGAKSGKAA